MYRDRNGKPITLEGLCALEPHWAASRVRTLEGDFYKACADADTWREKYRKVADQCALWRAAAQKLDKLITGYDNGDEIAIEAVEEACEAAVAFDHDHGVE
jgi:hypothetical protein